MKNDLFYYKLKFCTTKFMWTFYQYKEEFINKLDL